MKPSASRASLFWVLLLVFGAAVFARRVHNTSWSYPPGWKGSTSWFVTDPDSLYQFRRLERVYEEGLPVAETDGYLNYPEGAMIPWPPYYTLMLYAVTAPFAPEGRSARRAFLEVTAGSINVWIGAATAVMAALAGWYLAGSAGGLIAGLIFAFLFGSINYSNIGNADHHAWVSMLTAAMLMLVTGALSRGALESRLRGGVWGAAAGIVGGILLGSWVASLLYVIEVQLVLAWLLFRHARKPLAGLAAYGLSFHLAAFLVVMPAVLTSPWKAGHPWMVVNMSWFHPVQLFLGALVFLPLPFLGKEGRIRRRYPWLVGGGLLALTLILFLGNLGPAQAIREGFQWVSRQNVFMAGVGESQPLLGGKADGIDDLVSWLGWGIFLLPLAWLAALFATFRRGKAELLPWVISVLVLVPQAIGQRRFSDPLAVPMAVTLGWAAGSLLTLERPRFLNRAGRAFRSLPGGLQILLGVVLVCAVQFDTVHSISGRLTLAHRPETDPQLRRQRGRRLMYEWLRRHSREPADYSVMANWDQGHLIEWVADRPSVSTNFGTYVGEQSFDDPPLFFMSTSQEEAEAILDRRRARYVMVTSVFPRRVPNLVNIIMPDRRDEFIGRDPRGNPMIRTIWFKTIGALLVGDGFHYSPDGKKFSGPLRFLRLIYISPFRDFDPRMIGYRKESPVGWVWEHVPGATLEAHGTPGTVFQIRFSVRYEKAGHTLEYEDSVMLGTDGTGRLRVPYTTEGPNGDGMIIGRPQWFLGSSGHPLVIPKRAVLEGRTLQLPRKEGS